MTFEVAALNQCLSQADAFLKSAISLIPEIHKQIDVQNATSLSGLDVTSSSKLSITTLSSVEKQLNEFISNMLSTLLLIPDNPEQGVLYLLTGVLNLVNKHFQWENTEIKFNLLASFLVIFGAVTQENFIYHINNGTQFHILNYFWFFSYFLNLSWVKWHFIWKWY